MDGVVTTAETASKPRCPHRFSRTVGVHRLDVKLLGQRLIAQDFDRQVAALQVCIAVQNGFTALGTPVKKVVG